MAKNDFKAFATDRNANVMSQEEWEALPALLSGFTAGKASSAQVNKVIRQASFIAAALAQFVSDKTQRDVLDNGDLPGFVELLGSGFAVEYLSRNNPFGDIKSDGTVKTALENLGLGDGSGRYSKTVVFSSSGSYTWPADVKRIDVILTAAGGGGGGCNAENANQTFSGAGGGAGGTVFATIYATDNDAGPGTYTVTIGSGGSGANGPGSGNNGGHSSFMTLTALGGQGGQWGGATNTAGGLGGSGSGGYKTEQGGDGSDGQAGQALLVGNGASSYWGGGGRAGQLSGNSGVCSGSGGGGAYDNSYSHTSGRGGHGANGVLVIREYM
ncbi:TPA: carbohydrate kinase [Escherichia coli]|nr:carbohydrate kinase [Escherichia coli]